MLHAQVRFVCRFNKVRFTVQAVHTAASQPSASAAEVQKLEAQLLQKKSEMRQFESQYRQVGRAPVAMHLCSFLCIYADVAAPDALAASSCTHLKLQQRLVM